MDEDQTARLAAAGLTWCEWHHAYSDTGRVVNVIEQCSGAGIVIYACAPCREQYQLVPWAEHPRP